MSRTRCRESTETLLEQMLGEQALAAAEPAPARNEPPPVEVGVIKLAPRSWWRRLLGLAGERSS